MYICVSTCSNDVRMQSNSPISGHGGEKEGSNCGKYGKEMDVGSESVEKGVGGGGEVGKGVGDD